MVAADTVKSNVQETAADTTPEPAEQEHPSIIKLLALTVIGLVVILVSSDYAVDAAVALAKVFECEDGNGSGCQEHYIKFETIA